MRRWLKCGALALLCWTQGALAGTVLVVGDSISAAFGLETSQGWVHLLQERLVEGDESWRVVNASISGDTTAGGLARLDPLLEEHTPEVVILELGGNDGLRGQSPVQLKQNLADMIDRSREAGAEVLLLEGVGGVAGMMQADGIHPTAEAQSQLLETVWPALEPLL